MSQRLEQQWREETVYTDAEDGVLLQGTLTLPEVETGPTAVFIDDRGRLVRALRRIAA